MCSQFLQASEGEANWKSALHEVDHRTSQVQFPKALVNTYDEAFRKEACDLVMITESSFLLSGVLKEYLIQFAFTTTESDYQVLEKMCDIEGNVNVTFYISLWDLSISVFDLIAILGPVNLVDISVSFWNELCRLICPCI